MPRSLSFHRGRSLWRRPHPPVPAWPRDENVRFRLRAPGCTIVEAELRGGTLLDLRVTPAERQVDIVLPAGLQRSDSTRPFRTDRPPT